MKNEYNIAACIIAGGQSRRMLGKDKPLLKIADKTILDHILDKLHPQLNGPILINTNSDPKLFSNYSLPIIKDIIPDFAGPLAGILTAMDWLKNNESNIDYLLTIPGDLPLIPDNLLKKLISGYTEKETEIACAISNGKVHPVTAVWSMSLIHDLKESVINKKARKVMSWVETRKTVYIDWPTKPYDPFHNINCPEDVETAEQYLKIK